MLRYPPSRKSPWFTITSNFSEQNACQTHRSWAKCFRCMPADPEWIRKFLFLELVLVFDHNICLQNPWSLLASYRCQANVTRIELRVKVDEGIHGPVVVYICPKIHPKTVQVRVILWYTSSSRKSHMLSDPIIWSETAQLSYQSAFFWQ